MLEAIILAVVQGITEWLPVSSSGHLVLFQELFGLEEQIGFDLILHIASLLVVCFIFRKDIMSLIKGLLVGNKESGKLGMMLVIASIPIAIVGFFAQKIIELAFTSLLLVGISFIFTGLILWITQFPFRKKKMEYKDALWVGIFQALALFPGISRSGSTIAAGILRGVDRQKAARFSFLLFIPAIIGASLLNIKTFIINIEVIISFFVALVVSYIAIKLLLEVIAKRKFHYFSYYCWIVGIITLILA
jgi:undecaprenyl-diphosphatase